jgi:hypothetical protein
MRSLLFSALALGFLALIAYSWYAPAENLSPPAAALASLAVPGRAPASTASASLAEIHRLETTYRYGPSPGRAAAEEALAVTLAEHLTNFGADAELARAEIQLRAPLVQVVALQMLASLPPSAENLSALANGLRGSSDPALVEGAVRELRRYLGGSFEIDAQRIVEQFLGEDAKLPERNAETLLLPFINEHSYEEFRDLLAHLDAGATTAKFLHEALRAYERHRR